MKNVVHSTHFDKNGREGQTVSNGIEQSVRLNRKESYSITKQNMHR